AGRIIRKKSLKLGQRLRKSKIRALQNIHPHTLHLGAVGCNRIGTVHSFANYRLIRKISQQIAEHAPNAFVFMVTNQSDMMAEIAREYLPARQVLGVGGIIDSARFRYLLTNALRPHGDCPQENGHMIGYHTDDMIPLASSLTNDAVKEDVLASVVDATRRYGAEISALQKDATFPELSSSPSVSPGYAVYLAMAAFTGQIPSLEEAFNVALEDPALAQIWGVPTGAALSIPIRLRQGGYDVIAEHRLTSHERGHMGSAQAAMATTLAQLKYECEKGDGFDLW
ncbi:MAG: hypothetical protein P4L50_05990, partial [Anaerolineaceae bacterium]|nr:hypothetical protein [Anaerolineaceae bacterium]